MLCVYMLLALHSCGMFRKYNPYMCVSGVCVCVFNHSVIYSHRLCCLGLLFLLVICLPEDGFLFCITIKLKHASQARTHTLIHKEWYLNYINSIWHIRACTYFRCFDNREREHFFYALRGGGLLCATAFHCFYLCACVCVVCGSRKKTHTNTPETDGGKYKYIFLISRFDKLGCVHSRIVSIAAGDYNDTSWAGLQRRWPKAGGRRGGRGGTRKRTHSLELHAVHG